MTPYEQFISKKYRLLSDKQIADELSIPIYGKKGVGAIRRRLNLKRVDMSYTDRKKLAKLLEFWFNGHTVANAARECNIPLPIACRLIKNHAMYIPRSYNTITLVIESKMNFTEAELELIENEYLKPGV